MNATARNALIALVLVALVAVPALAQTTTTTKRAQQECLAQVGQFVTNIAAGEVGWVTDGRSEVDFVNCPIPPGTFGGNEGLSGVTVEVEGVPLDPELGEIDTVVEVGGVNCLREGETKSMATEIQALNMRSTSPVTINGEPWDMEVFVANTQNPGAITLTLDDENGGTFTSDLPVQGLLRFTNLNTGDTVDVADSCEVHFTPDSATAWALARDGGFDPDAAGLPPLPGGVAIDGDGDGVDDYVTNGRTNFIPGVEVVTGSGLTADGTATTSTFTWKYWLFRELYLLFKHLVWIKFIDPVIVEEREVIDAQEAEVVDSNLAFN